MAKLKVGIIGCGKMGKVYARWFSQNASCEVKAFYNRTISRAEELSNLYKGSKVFPAWQELVKEKELDIIGMCTPSHEHLEQFKLALAAGKHVLCEKPMATDINECQEMVNLSKRVRIKAMVGFQMRFHPVIQEVNGIIKTIGRVFHIDFVFGMYRPEITWRHKIIQGGGVLKELSSHLFDLARFWLGELSYITAQNKIIQTGREVEDYSVNLMEFKNGASGYLFSNYSDRRSRMIHGNIMGTSGQIEFQFSSYDPADSKVVLWQNNNKTECKVEIPAEIDEIYPGHMDSFKKEIDYFVKAIVDDKDITESCVEGMKSIEIIDASYESQRTGKKIGLPLVNFRKKNLKDSFEKFC